jgi:hypothetical protein
MRKLFIRSLLVLLASGSFVAPVYAQNFLKVAGGFSFSKEKKFVQSFAFDLNRTEEVKEKQASHYFLYTNDGFYIIPTVDVNIGETVTASENNIVTQVNFGKKIYDGKLDGKKQYWRLYLEGSPVYNADKDFDERKYYLQVKMIGSSIFKSRNDDKDFFDRVFSININPLLNIGTRNSKTYAANHTYSAAGLNTEFKLRINTIDSAQKISERWTIKLTANGYRLLSEIDALYSKDYYGQLTGSVDYAINAKFGISISYKYGNDNAKYTTANVLEAGFKIKY